MKREKSESLARHRFSYEKKKSLVGFFFIVPWIVGTAIFFLVPLVQSVLYSFGKIQLVDNGYELQMVGLANFRTIFNDDPYFFPLVVDEFKNMIINTPIIVIFSLFIALLLKQDFRGRTFVRGVFFLPVIIANGVIITIINGDVFTDVIMSDAGSSQLFRSEFFSSLMLESGISQDIVNGLTGIIDNMFELIWKTGVQILIFLAGLQTISTAMYEAAKIEGASGWELFWRVTFPMISPMILLNVIYTIIDSFTDYSNEVMKYIDTQTTGMKMELGSAMAWLYFLAVLVLMGIVYAFVSRRVYYET